MWHKDCFLVLVTVTSQNTLLFLQPISVIELYFSDLAEIATLNGQFTQNEKLVVIICSPLCCPIHSRFICRILRTDRLIHFHCMEKKNNESE